ncbi:MAG: histidinol-phosphate transaminase [Paludibacteraceae bacterium]|nr:histidinol-phosphate transaminase [Paludibacteraceae bacterium]
MKFPNKYLRNLKPYRLASHKIWMVTPKERSLVLKLDWNEATIPPSPKVRERMNQLLQEPDFFNLYPTTYNETLHNLLSSYVSLPKENIQYFASSDALHEYICKVFISVGDPIMILGPSYDNFRLTCQANGAEVFFFNYNTDFTFDAETFESEIITKEPAVVYICNPNNPTGNLHSVEYIEHLLFTFPDTLFLIDEAYYEFSGVSCKDLVLTHDNILISRTMSKAFALANFRVGYLIGSTDNVQFVNRIRNPKNLTTFAQEAAIAALSDIKYMQMYVKEVNTAKTQFLLDCAAYNPYICVYPSFGNFVLVQCHSYEEKIAMVNFFADNNIFVRDTTQSNLVRNCFRITIGTCKQMEYVNSIFGEYFSQHYGYEGESGSI